MHAVEAVARQRANISTGSIMAEVKPADRIKSIVLSAVILLVAVGATVVIFRTEPTAQRGGASKDVGDDELDEVVAGQQDGGRALHLPSGAPALERSDPELELLLDSLVTELESLERTRDLESLERADDLRVGWQELHPWGDEPLPLTEGERAHIAAAHRDRVVLDTDRWFPRVDGARQTVEPEAGSEDDRDLEALRVVLATVADVTELIGGSRLFRQADAIELIERLLGDASLTPWRYMQLVESYPKQARIALAPVHAVVESAALQ
jgi:hypothetical protein